MNIYEKAALQIELIEAGADPALDHLSATNRWKEINEQVIAVIQQVAELTGLSMEEVDQGIFKYRCPIPPCPNCGSQKWRAELQAVTYLILSDDRKEWEYDSTHNDPPVKFNCYACGNSVPHTHDGITDALIKHYQESNS